MKKSLILAFALVVGASMAMAVEDNPVYGSVNKLVRGLVNFTTGWVEIPAQSYKGYKAGYNNGGCINTKDNPAASRSIGSVIGVGRGVYHFIGRTAWGVAEVATFWAKDPMPAGDKELVFDSKYVWEMGTQSKFYDPTAKDGWRKLGNNFTHGCFDISRAPVEITCQMEVQDDRHPNGWQVIPGFFNGVWLCGSRLGNGFFEASLCFLPRPEGKKNIPYDANHSYAYCLK